MAERRSEVDALVAALVTAEHGGSACDALEKLVAIAPQEARAVEAIAAYAVRGAFGHIRSFATAKLATEVPGGADAGRRPLFEALLEDPVTRYWAVDGLLKSAAGAAYPRLVGLALDEGARLADRAKAVKALAVHAGQTFDRGLPKDPGKWKAGDLKLQEVRQWMAGGYPVGIGHAPLKRHAALDAPKTPLERAAARLDSMLAQSRLEDDPADPRNRLVPGEPGRLRAVMARWPLPKEYAEFLTDFSPVHVTVESERFWNGGLRLFGVDDLECAQVGYSADSDGGPLAGWPAGLLVIASHAGDPVVLDLERGNRRTAPVGSARHGKGSWRFQPEWASFTAFLENVSEPGGASPAERVLAWLRTRPATGRGSEGV